MLGADKWVPTKKLKDVFDMIATIFIEPNMDTPINANAANLYKTDIKKFKEKVLEVYKES